MAIYFDNWHVMVRTGTLNWWKDRNQNVIVLSSSDEAWAPCREKNPVLEEPVWWQYEGDGWTKKDGEEEESLISQSFEQDCIFPTYLSGYTQWCYTSVFKFLSTTQAFSAGVFYVSPLLMTLIVTCTFIYCSLPFLENKTKPQTNTPPQTTTN